MPHLTIEYTRNLEPGFAIAATLQEVNAALLGTGEIRANTDLKSRMVPLDQSLVGAAGGSHGFVYCALRLLPGRNDETKAMLSECIARVMRQRIPQPQGMTVQLSVEVLDMHRPSYVKEILPG